MTLLPWLPACHLWGRLAPPLNQEGPVQLVSVYLHRCRKDVSAAQANLQQVLLAMRKLLHLPRLEYVSIQNQADFLIEVPVEMTDVPKVCCDCHSHSAL